MPDQVYSVKWNDEEKLSYTYDPLGRLSTRTLHVTGNVASIPQLTTQYTYIDVGEDHTTTMVQSVSTGGITHNYTYDAVGNITSIQIGAEFISYEYDALNQLVRVNDSIDDQTVTYEYENGNITWEHIYDYTTGDLPETPKQSVQYHYNDPVWRDVLTNISYLRYTSDGTAYAASAYSADAAAEDDAAAALAESLLGENFHAVELTENDLFGGVGAAGTSAFGAQTASAQANSSAVVESTSTIQSDEIGNIIDVDGMEFVWEGRQLQSIGANGTPFFSYEYNIDGQRTKKTVTDFDTGETTTTEYFYNSGMLMGQKTGNDVLVFMYDESGDMFGFTYNGTPYYYVKNAQNDVWAVTNADGQAVVLYFYDAWGNVTRSYEADGYEAIAEVNPILYRSYYCDLELGFYYLNTRYYVPAIHRFLNADGVLGANQDINAYNLFAYCSNDPVNYMDETGQGRTIVHCYGNRYCPICGFPTRKPTGGTGATRSFNPTPAKDVTTTFARETVKSVIGGAVDSYTGSQIGTLRDTRLRINHASLSTAFPNLKTYTYEPIKSVQTLKGISKYAGGVATIALFAWDIGSDYMNYGGNMEDFAKAATVTTLATVATVAIGFFMPATAVGVISAIAIGAAIGTVTPYIKEWWIGY